MRPSAPKPFAGRLVHRAWLLALWAFASYATAFYLSANDPLPQAENPHLAYIGPGAGFAFLGSFLSLLIAFILGAASLLIWPFRVAWRALTRRKGLKKARVRKIIFLGLDGLDPDLSGALHGRGQNASPGEAARAGRLQPVADDVSAALAGGLVDFRHRRQSRQAQHVRLPEPQHEDLRAGTFLLAGWRAQEVSQDREMANPFGQTDGRAAPQEPHVLEYSGRASGWMHGAAGSHYVPAGEV